MSSVIGSLLVVLSVIRVRTVGWYTQWYYKDEWYSESGIGSGMVE